MSARISFTYLSGVFAMLSIFLAPAALAAKAVPATAATRTAQEDNIRIAVFTFQFTQAYSGRPANCPYYFLCGGFVHKHPYNPRKTVLDHFAGFKPPVYGITEASHYSNPAVGCKIDLVKWISPTEVHVNAEMFPVDGAQIDFATGYNYTLILKNGGWTVTKHKMVWIQ